MTEHPYSCGESCPFRGCHECAFKGWETPAQQQDSAREEADGGRTNRTSDGKVGAQLKTAPAGALTPVSPGPRPTETAKSHGRTCIT